MKTKTCSNCGRDKPLLDFGRNAQNPDGLQYTCRVCTAAARRQWSASNPERARAIKQRYRDRMRQLNHTRDPYTESA